MVGIERKLIKPLTFFRKILKFPVDILAYVC